MDDTKFPRHGLERVEDALAAVEADVSRVGIERLGDVLRDFTLGGNSLPRETQRRLENLLDSVSTPLMAGRGMLRGYITLALHARYDLRRDEAISFTSKALAWAKQSGDASLIACAYKFLGIFQAEAGYLAEALHYLLQGLAALGQSGTLQARAELLTVIGTVLQWGGQCRQALNAYRRALALKSDTSVSSRTVWVIHANMSLCYLALGEYRNGLRAASIALNLQEEATCDGNHLDLELGNFFAARLLM